MKISWLSIFTLLVYLVGKVKLKFLALSKATIAAPMVLDLISQSAIQTIKLVLLG